MMMLCFAFGQLIHLADGTFAVRSLDYPEVEGRGNDGWSAREQFRHALGECVQRVIDQGQLPILLDSVNDISRSFPKYSKNYLDAADRLPKSSDIALIIPVELAPDTAVALQRISSAALETEPSTSSQNDSGWAFGNDSTPSKDETNGTPK
jgi:hypothetical protein